MSRLQLDLLEQVVERIADFPSQGRVTNVVGLMMEGYCKNATIGSITTVYSLDESKSMEAEVVGFKDDKALMMPLRELHGVGIGSRIVLKRRQASVKISESMIGRVLNGNLEPIDGGPALVADEEFSLYVRPLNPLKRGRVERTIDTGVRSINGLLTLGLGQRMAILSGSGVGKSMLLGMIARNTSADINVIALIGERGREVREFLEKNLGSEGLQRSVVIVATSDSSPLERVRAAYGATAVAEFFRRRSQDVLLMMDSITRYAMALREIGLSAGEPPTTKGYPPSVFGMLPKLLERAGNLTSGGSITGIYTVLIEADDINDPIGDTVRSIVDGHIVLSRKLAAKGHFPSIDVGYSSSRVMDDITSDEHRNLAMRIKSLMATYSEAEDLINIGAYAKGSNPTIDEAIQYQQAIRSFLIQPYSEATKISETLERMKSIFQGAQAQVQGNAQATRGGRR